MNVHRVPCESSHLYLLIYTPLRKAKYIISFQTHTHTRSFFSYKYIQHFGILHTSIDQFGYTFRHLRSLLPLFHPSRSRSLVSFSAR